MNDGGPAFPTDQWDSKIFSFNGMSLLDYFAAHAPEIDQIHGGESKFAQDARHRYTWADAMIAERARRRRETL